MENPMAAASVESVCQPYQCRWVVDMSSFRYSDVLPICRCSATGSWVGAAASESFAVRIGADCANTGDDRQVKSIASSRGLILMVTHSAWLVPCLRVVQSRRHLEVSSCHVVRPTDWQLSRKGQLQIQGKHRRSKVSKRQQSMRRALV